MLENAVVRLSPFREGDREALRRVAADPDLWRYHALNQYAATFDNWFDASLARLAAGEWLPFIVRLGRTDNIVGSSSYLEIVPAHKRLEIGSTWYAKAHQGSAVNPATKLLLMGHAFDELGYNRVEFKLDRRNARSWAAMRKLGATEEGIFRSHMVLPDGHVRDSVYFSVIAQDWPRIKAGLEARLARLTEAPTQPPQSAA